MTGPSPAPPPRPDAVCDGGDLDCGSGLLLIIRDAMKPVPVGGVLEVRSREGSVREDLPAWCRMVGHTMDLVRPGDAGSTSYFLRKGGGDERLGPDLERARAHSWTVRVRSRDGMQAKAYARNHTIPLGQPASLDTADDAPAAVETLLAALGGCLAVGFRWRASKRGVVVREVEVSLRARSDNLLAFLGVEDTGHAGLASVEGSIFVDADAEDAVLEEVWRDTLARSPVAQSLARGVPLSVGLKRS